MSIRIRSNMGLGSCRIGSVVDLVLLYRRKNSNVYAVRNSSMLTGAHWNRPSLIHLASARFLCQAAASAHDIMPKNGNPSPTSSSQPQSSSPPLPPPHTGRFSTWVKVVFGSFFSMVALWTPEWATDLLKIGEVMIKQADEVAEVVEKVATMVEEASEELADKLPNDNKIKKAILMVEHASEVAAKDAHIVDQMIHKIDHVVKQEKDVVEEIVHPIIGKIIHDGKSRKAVDH